MNKPNIKLALLIALSLFVSFWASMCMSWQEELDLRENSASLSQLP